MEITTYKTKTEKPKVWSRKGECPSCGVGGGSKHGKNCNLIYKPKVMFTEEQAKRYQENEEANKRESRLIITALVYGIILGVACTWGI